MEGHCGNRPSRIPSAEDKNNSGLDLSRGTTRTRPHSLSVASTSTNISEDSPESDVFCSNDSRRSTISSVCCDTPGPEHQQKHQETKACGQLQLQPHNIDNNNVTCRSPSATCGSTPHLSNSALLGANTTTTTPAQPQTLPTSPTPTSNFPASPASLDSSPLTRNRENARQLHEARLQRQRATSSGTTTSGGSQRLLRRKRDTRKFQPANPKAALAATEPPHENLLTKMAFAEQQRWITVQQKTFTKWLNTKIEGRNQVVNDLVVDLSDGVCLVPQSRPTWLAVGCS